MQELISHHFEERNIPPTWFPQGMNRTYERGCLRSGRCTQMWIPLKGNGWNRIRVEADVEPVGGAVIDCGDGVVALALKVKEGDYPRHCAIRHSSVLMESFERVPDKPGIRHVAIEFDHGQLRGLVDGKEFIRAVDPSPHPIMGVLTLGFWNDCLVHRIRVLGADELASPLHPLPPRRRQDFFLDMVVDFYDDWWPADSAILIGERVKYSRAMYEEFFSELKRCGVRRVAWNYHDLLDTNEKGRR